HFKHDPCGNTYYAFACGIAEAVLNKGITDDIDLIVPIPISANKMKERGYNQTELIAEELRFIILKPCINALSKKKDTKEQKSLSYKDRIMNIKDSYEYSEKAGNITGKRILLIDDVCTTGSTLSEAASVLRSAGASKIYAASFARTRYRAGNEEKQ
ncbi:MAG: ComF family protein, partial [Ruminiclostridium sp.]|nr:ComF family protein [Ruminiclostridium sp.]